MGIRIYQLGTITRLITTLDPVEQADVSAPLRPSLRYATTPEWLTIRSEATGFEFGEEHFEIVLSELLSQILSVPVTMPSDSWVHATAPVAAVSLSQAQRLRLNDYTTFFRTKQRAELLLVEGELPSVVADGAGLRWFTAQIARTAETVARNLSLAADV